MNESINNLIGCLQTLPNEWIGVLIYMAAIITLFIFHRLFGKEGLFVFIVLSVVIANIQVLKAIKMSFFNYPIAMGSILFSASLLATDCLIEYYGRQEAKKAIWLGFASMVMMSLFMLLTLGTSVIHAAPDSSLYHYVEIDQAMRLIFTPAPAILISSLIAYLVSQYLDISVFLWFRKKTQGKFLGLRTLASTFFSTVVDNALFSVLAWKVFYPLPIDFKTFVVTYMIGALGLRIFVNIVNTPFIYFIKRPAGNLNHESLS